MNRENSPSALSSITFLTGSLAGKIYQVGQSGITIGREAGNDIVVPDQSISRRHAGITWSNGTWTINKLSPQNRLIVNQQDVQQVLLQNNATVALGTEVSFRFQIQNVGVVQPAGPAPSTRPGNRSGTQHIVPSIPSEEQNALTPHKIPAVSAPPSSQVSGPISSAQVMPPNKREEAYTVRAPEPMMSGEESTSSTSGASGVATLEVSTNTDREKQVFPLNRQIINIGREPANDILIDRPTVSGFHAQIVREGNDLVLIHPHPARNRTLNGLIYQGKVIGGDQPFRKKLMRGDIFRISDEHGSFVTLTYNDGSGAPQDIVPEIRPIPLGMALIKLGRLPDNTVVLNHPQVSGHHACMEQVQGGYRLSDLGSTNHVYVNAERVSNRLLKPGDEIRIGPFKLTYTETQLTQYDESHSVRIDALQLKKVGNKETILINDISIPIPPRKFIALVGGSGAGKSTLMDALNGQRPAQQGKVLYNGQDYYRNLAAYSTQLGYVPQDDIVHRDLTVERALYYAAKLRLPGDYSEAQIQQRIDEVLDDVEMKFRRGLQVSKLSGGQRKRVSIALELLANPSVFFLDEPTSGLDPGLDRKMMLLLRKLADKGHTVILVTHATNNINACDYVCFLCQGGRLAYYGPPEEAKTYFNKTDFAEIYSTLEPTEENKNIPAEAEARFNASADFQKYVVSVLNQGPAGQLKADQPVTEVKVLSVKSTNPWKQFVLLAMRYLELLKNDKGNLLILLLQAPVIGIILLFMSDAGVFAPNSVANCPSRSIPGIPPELTNFRGSCKAAVDTINQALGNPATVQAITSKGGADAVLNNLIQIGSGGDAQKILFIMAFAAVMFGCINGAREIVKEVAIYRRERSVNLGIAPYLFSKIVVLGVLCLLQSLVLVLFVEIKAPLHQGVILPPLLENYITLSLTSIAGLMVGLMVSAISPNTDRATSLIPIILIPQVIFSGIIFPLSNVGLKILGGLFAASWAMAGMGSSVGLHSDKLGGQIDCSYVSPPVDPPDTHFYGPGANPGNCAFRGDYMVSVTNQSGAHAAAVQHILTIWAALIVMSIVLGIITAYFLKRKDIKG